ncbi:hypothetical protein [Sphingomonas sp. 3-13AW]|uniref:hypothetical protein n=1 Tax=Sphingomonas sp. 3-13AW TaxID=3050450 RepID=UPI003BB4E48A
MKSNRNLSAAIFVIILALAICMGAGLAFMRGGTLQPMTPEQIQALVRAQADDCRPMVRESFKNKIVQHQRALQTQEAEAIVNRIKDYECRAATEQLDALRTDAVLGMF